MPNTPGNPLPKIRIINWRKEAPIGLLPRQSLLRRNTTSITLSRGPNTALLLPPLNIPSVIRLPLLAIVYKKRYSSGYADND